MIPFNVMIEIHKRALFRNPPLENETSEMKAMREQAEKKYASLPPGTIVDFPFDTEADHLEPEDVDVDMKVEAREYEP